MRSFAYVLLAAVAAAGCAESAAPSFPIDAGRDASIDPDAGGNGGAGGEGGSGAGGEGGAAGVAGSGGSSGPWCETSTLCPGCPDPAALCDALNPCPVGQVCLLTGCQDCDDTSCVDLSRCFIAGAGACQEPADCPDPAYSCDLTIGRCLRTDGLCDDSNDCIAGFACEDRRCVDRRLPCAVGADCPHGYTCFFASPDQRFCRRITRPCGDDFDCLVLGVPCGDADEDGLGECMPSLAPNEPEVIPCDKTQCELGPGPVCETTPDGTGAVCGQFGLCAAASDCDEGFECRDLFGDGRTECVMPPGSCVDSRDCAIRSLCASPRAGEAPTCVGEQAM